MSSFVAFYGLRTVADLVAAASLVLKNGSSAPEVARALVGQSPSSSFSKIGAAWLSLSALGSFFYLFRNASLIKRGLVVPEEAGLANTLVVASRTLSAAMLVLAGPLKLPSLAYSFYTDLPLAVFYAGSWATLTAARSMQTDTAVELEALRDNYYAASGHQQAAVQALSGEVRETLKAIERTVYHTSSLHPMNPGLNLHHATVLHAVETSLGNVKHLTDVITKMHEVEPDGLGLHGMEWIPSFAEFDLAFVAENIGDALTGVADEKGIELVVSCPLERGRQHLYLVIGDKDMMTQVLFKVGVPFEAARGGPSNRSHLIPFLPSTNSFLDLLSSWPNPIPAWSSTSGLRRHDWQA